MYVSFDFIIDFLQELKEEHPKALIDTNLTIKELYAEYKGVEIE